MRGAVRALLALAALVVSVGAPAAEPEWAVAEMTRLADDVRVGKVAPSLWVFTTTRTSPDGSVVPANGMLLETPHGAVLVDPGWNDTQARVLLSWVEKTLKSEVILGIVTHSHEDRTGGAGALAAARIAVLASPRTAEILQAKGTSLAFRVRPSLTRREKVPDPLGFTLLYPGPGHAPDNIVVWFAKARVLFCGCFVKAATAEGLGNIADAALPEWPHAIAAVRRAFPSPSLVVPGHGAAGGDALGRTLQLLKAKEHEAKAAGK